MRASRGFTLIEMVVVIAVIAILAGALVPVITRPYIVERKNEVIRELGQIEEAIAGRPDLGDYGFIGTIGRLPTSVGELMAQGSLPSVSAPNGVPVGWNGPYLRAQTQDPTTDAWGSPYVIETTGAGNAQWRLRSNGPDRAPGGVDDIVYPVDGAPGVWWNSRGRLILDLQAYNGTGNAPVPDVWLTGVTNGIPNGITVYIPQNGSQVALPVCNASHCDWPSVPFGIHPVKVVITNATNCPAGCTYNMTLTNTRPIAYQQLTVTAPYNPVTGPFQFTAGTPVNGEAVTPLTSLPFTPNQIFTLVFNGSVRPTANNQSCFMALSANGDPSPPQYTWANLNSDPAKVRDARAVNIIGNGATPDTVPITLVRTYQAPSTGGVLPMGVFIAGGGPGNCAWGNGSLTVYAGVP